MERSLSFKGVDPKRILVRGNLLAARWEAAPPLRQPDLSRVSLFQMLNKVSAPPDGLEGSDAAASLLDGRFLALHFPPSSLFFPHKASTELRRGLRK